jgi:hypothetical protein
MGMHRTEFVAYFFLSQHDESLKKAEEILTKWREELDN